jgi:transposase
MHEQQPAIPFYVALIGEVERLRAENAALRAPSLPQGWRSRRRLSSSCCNGCRSWRPNWLRTATTKAKPPSSDPPFKKPPPRSLRQSSGKKPGGQKGHPGATLELVEEPDRTMILPLTGHCECGRCRAGIVASLLPERRQVTERVRPARGHRVSHRRRGMRLWPGTA